MNLMVNACQAIRGKGSIRIRCFQQDGGVRVAFTDTGCGIPPEILPKIFDPFFTTKPVGQGTGLGLSMCYGIMQKHEGQVLVESIPGQGSTFTVVLHPTLPAATGKDELAEGRLVAQSLPTSSESGTEG
jgi:two-component system NtrC family sensor kinase